MADRPPSHAGADMFSQLISVRRLFSQSSFKPAKVQRQYVWDAQECEIFHNDLEEAFGVSSSGDYYLGPMILADAQDEDVVWVYDGQQRLTTLTIYLTALSQVCRGPEQARAAALSQVLRKDEIRPRIDLRTRGGALTRVVRGVRQFRTDPRNMPVDWRIYNIEKMFLERLKGMPDVNEFARWVQSHVLINVLWARDDSGLVLFDRANNRGVRLAWYELAKSVISEAAGDDLKVRAGRTFDELWYETERGAKHEFPDLVAATAFIRYGEIDPARALTGFEDEFDASEDEGSRFAAVRDFSQKLEAYALTSARLQTLRDTRAGVERQSDLIRLQLLFLGYPHWKSLLMCAEERVMRGPEELMFLERLRRVSYMAHLLGWPLWPKRLDDMFRLALAEFQAGRAEEAGIGADLLVFTGEQRAQARGALAGSITDDSFYRPLVKLWESEQAHGNGTLDSSATFLAHVEHILPRAPRGEWCRAFHDEDERADLKNRLGNLCLLHRDDNNRASNLEWRVKRDIYRKAGPAYAGAHEVTMEEHWTPDLVKSRTRRMADGIIKLLAI